MNEARRELSSGEDTNATNDDAVDMVCSNNDLLSKIILFLDVVDVPAICRICQHWKNCFEAVEEELFEVLAKKHHPSLEQLRGKLLLNTTTDAASWKALLKGKLASSYVPVGMNKQLQDDFKTVFFHEGIVAFSNCCHIMCSDAYNEGEPTFQCREKGINLIRLHLNGMNYHQSVDSVACHYEDYDYLDENWDSECALLERWCSILGLGPGKYSIEKPECIHKCVMINFCKPVELETDSPWWGDEEEEEADVESEDDESEDHGDDSNDNDGEDLGEPSSKKQKTEGNGAED